MGGVFTLVFQFILPVLLLKHLGDRIVHSVYLPGGRLEYTGYEILQRQNM